MTDNNDDSKDDVPLAFRVIRGPTLDDYFAAGGEIEKFFKGEKGGGTAKLEVLAERTGLSERSLWQMLKLRRFYDKKALDKAKRFGASWSDLRDFMQKASGKTLAPEDRGQFETMLKSAKKKRANWDGADTP